METERSARQWRSQESEEGNIILIDRSSNQNPKQNMLITLTNQAVEQIKILIPSTNTHPAFVIV